jgi:bifunctional non-homologous end joining protein LigD
MQRTEAHIRSELDFEGIVSKRADARYVSDSNPYWIKVPCHHRDTFLVVGWAEKDKKYDGIYLGRSEGAELVYAGKLERGSRNRTRGATLQRLAPLKIRREPQTLPKARWVKPVVMIDAEFRGKTGDGLLCYGRSVDLNGQGTRAARGRGGIRRRRRGSLRARRQA